MVQISLSSKFIPKFFIIGILGNALKSKIVDLLSDTVHCIWGATAVSSR